MQSELDENNSGTIDLGPAFRFDAPAMVDTDEGPMRWAAALVKGKLPKAERMRWEEHLQRVNQAYRSALYGAEVEAAEGE